MEPFKSRSFFHPRLSSAIEITKDNKNDVEALVQKKVKEGWRWVSKDFINDKGYDHKGYDHDSKYERTNYRVKEQTTKPNENDLKNVDIVLVNEIFNDDFDDDVKKFFYIDNEGVLSDSTCTSEWGAERLAASFKINSEGYLFQPNPVLKARQMPKLEKGNWVAIQGKTLRVIKESDKSTITNLKTHKLHEENGIEGIFLSKHFFEGSYARLTGAYIRRLERSGYLKEAFEQFFYKKLVKLPSGKNITVNLATGSREVGSYNSYIKFTLSQEILTNEDLDLLKKALGISLDARKLTKNSTLENTVPFKKILEILTGYNINHIHPCNAKNVAILVNFQISNTKEVEFLLNADKKNPSQLIISRKKEKGSYFYVGNSYTYWLSTNPKQIDNIPDAETAEFFLNNTFADCKERIKDWGINKTSNLIEFLACTQLVEAHATPGQLEDSRVPGMGKLARFLIKEAKENNLPLSDFFHADKLTIADAFYPMAANGGTSNGRDAVKAITRINTPTEDGEIERKNNAPDYDMSADSDVEF